MDLTLKQIEGIKVSKHRYMAREAYTCIAGYAGTGKSTLVKFLMAELAIPSEKVAYATFTGKAALVLQQKGHSGAMTLHKLLYKSFKNKDGTFSHMPKEQLDKPYEIIIVDEVSMVPKYIWLQALKHGVHIIALGDPFQLPPIGEDNGILASPHVFLDEVMRQALESDIIRISMEIRQGKKLGTMNGKDVKIITQSQLVSGMYAWADQIICGRNNTRHMINRQMRSMLNMGAEPQEGDKVICLKNYWDIENELGDPLINGMIGKLCAIKMGSSPSTFETTMTASFMPDFIEEGIPFDGAIRDQQLDYKQLTTGVSGLAKDARPTYRGGKKIPLPLAFDYGYAITCHKSQGSQFNKVLLFDEVLNREMHARWLYTAITRAVEKIVIVVPDGTRTYDAINGKQIPNGTIDTFGQPLIF